MKRFLIIFFLVLIGCQKTEETAKTGPQPEKVGQIEEDLALNKSDFVFIPNVPGLKIEGERITRQGDLSVAENLKITDTEGKVIDDFSLFDWGPVGFKTEGNALKVFPVKDVLEVNYEVNVKKKVIRKSTCHFKTRPDSAKFGSIVAETKTTGADYESIFSRLGELAINGDKRSYDFFISPNKEDKEVLKHADGEASSGPIIKVLKYMKQQGCVW